MFGQQLQVALGEAWHLSWILVLIIAVISIITGFVKEYIPQHKLQTKLKNQSPVKGAIMGAGLGIPTPFCSASMVPVAMGMIEMSAPLSTVLPFLISAPLTNFVVLSMIFGVFGIKVAAFYFIWTFSCAVIAGLTVGRSGVKNHVKNITGTSTDNNKHNNAKENTSCCAQTTTLCSDYVTENNDDVSCTASERINSIHKEKVANALQFAKALFKQIIPYVLVGAIISGILVAYMPDNVVQKYLGDGSLYSIPLGAIIGVPLYLRIEMAIPILNALLGKGMNIGAAIAVLIGGTGASLPEVAIISSMLKPKAVFAFVLTVITIATAGGFLSLIII